MSKTAFVTGGTGFLGINLIRALCAEGWHLTVLHRASSNLKYIQDLPIQLVKGSITDRESLERVMPEGLDVVFHLAGDTNMWSRNNARQTEINVDGTRNMIEVSAQKKATTFIHTSSISAWRSGDHQIDETSPQLGGQSWINYEKSKFLGEEEARKGLALGLRVVIINPGSIVGPYDSGTWAKMFYALRDKKAPGTPPGNNSYVHVHDVVQALILAVEKGQNGHNYIITGENTSIKTFIQEVAGLLELERIPPVLPGWFLKIVARLMAFTALFTGKEPTLTPEIAVFLSRKNLAFSSEKALRELGYKQTPWREGLRANYEWLKQEGLL
ncbi:MAG: NAD-dependent epimerase/dehydratase family protein [Saprospiraceae bacterium]